MDQSNHLTAKLIFCESGSLHRFSQMTTDEGLFEQN